MEVLAGERLLKKIFAGMSEQQKQETMAHAKETVNNGSGSEILRRSLDSCTIFFFSSLSSLETILTY